MRLAALKFGAAAIVATALAGCAQPPGPHARGHGSEYFSQAKYGRASPRVVEDGEPVPRGGGQYLVGRPYTVAGHTYYPRENASYTAVGYASWYGDAFHGRRTANGEVYDMRSFTAAHPTMPLPSYARVTNLGNGYSMIVRVNDRGPFERDRLMDVSSRVADVLDIKSTGSARVKVEYVGPAPLEGSDDDALLASLRTDGAPSTFDGAPTMVAAAAPNEAPAETKAAPPSPPAPKDEASEAPRAVAFSPPNPKLFKAPPPPPRPFDLGEIARTVESVDAKAPTPPRRPVRQALAGERSLYFADESAGSLLLKSDPFARLIEAGEAPRAAATPANGR